MAERKTISQRIALEGAEEIKRLLAEIGQSGEKAFAQVRDAVEKARSNLARVSAAVADVEKQVGRVAVAGRNFGSAMGDMSGALGRFGGALANTATRLGALSAAAVAAGAGVFALAKSASGAADEIGKQSQALGVTVQSYQRLQFAAAQAGVSQEQFAGGIARFSKVVTDAAKEQDKAARGLAASLKAMRRARRVCVDCSPCSREPNVSRKRAVRQRNAFLFACSTSLPGRALMRLIAIELENFKGIGPRQRIELKPITLLFGPNSAGKSTILQALHYLREILERKNVDPDVTIAGGLLDLGGFKSVVHKHDLSQAMRIKIEVAFSPFTSFGHLPLNSDGPEAVGGDFSGLDIAYIARDAG